MSALGDSTPRPPRLGRYELITRIGQGGMAEVQLALQRGPAGFEKLVVVKLVHENLASQRPFVDMLLDEARMAALVKHPNVVDIYDLGEAEGRYFIAMEYLEGEPLLAVLRAGRDGERLDVLSTTRLIADTAEGLDAAHELRSMAGDPIELVHHDISLGNIVVLYNGQAKLVDFGVAKATQSATSHRKVQGKFSYMAPEKLRGGAGDRRSDIWSLGCVLWEALTLKRLFKGGNDSDTMQQVLDSVILAPSDVNGDVPVELDAVALRALARDPADRYPTAKAMAADLEAVLHKRGYAAKNDRIATYMQATFEGHIAARKKLLQEVSSKGRASQAVLEAAFTDGAIASGSPSLTTEPVPRHEPDGRITRWAVPLVVPQDVPRAPAGRPTADAPRPAEPPPPAGDERTVVDSPALSDDRPWIAQAAAEAAAEAVDAALQPPRTVPAGTMPPAVVAPPEVVSVGDELTDIESRPLARNHRWLVYPACSAALLAVVAVLSLRAGREAAPPEPTPPTSAPAVTAGEPAVTAGEPVPPPRVEPAAVADPTTRVPRAPADVTAGAPAPIAAVPKPAAPQPAEPPRVVHAHRAAAPKPMSHAPAPVPDKINPDEVFKAGLQAWVHGDTKTALASYKRVIQASPGFAPAWRNLGLVYERLGDRGAAHAAFQKYLQLSPQAADAAEIRGRLDQP